MAQCSKLSKDEVWGLAKVAAKESGLDPSIHYGMFMVESGGNPCAVSGAGAKGLAQFMPGTADRFGLSNPFDPHASAVASGRYMKKLTGMFNGDTSKAIMAYNAGEGNIKKGRIPAETRKYLPSVLARAKTAPGGAGSLPDPTVVAQAPVTKRRPKKGTVPTPAAPTTPSETTAPTEEAASQRDIFKGLFQVSQAEPETMEAVTSAGIPQVSSIDTPEAALEALGFMPFIDPASGLRQMALQTTPEDRSLVDKFSDYDEQVRGQLLALNEKLSQSEQGDTTAPFSSYPSVFDDRLLKLLDRV